MREETEMSKIKVLEAKVWWGDGYVNEPTVRFVIDRAPVFDIYEKRPCGQETLSAEQAAVVGSKMRRQVDGWHVYYSEDDEFSTFFTWDGKPDEGFGRWRRTIKLSDGTEEEIIGGWHTGPDVAVEAGFPPCVDTSYVLDADDRVGLACFISEERFRLEVERLLPDVEVIRSIYNGLTVKWRNQVSKAEFVDIEADRQEQVRNSLKAKYPGDWYYCATDEERDQFSTQPYSALGKKS